MENRNTKSVVISSLIWKLMERGGVQGIQFILQVVLARLLLPEDFGTIAIVMVFITFARVFVQRGFNTALIQKKEVSSVDFSSVLYLSLFVSGLIYIIIFFMAPTISAFYNDPTLTSILRVLAITLFFGAFNSIQIAYISRNMMFKILFFSSFLASIIAGVGGIIAAISGLGVWALVIQQLVNQIVISIIMYITVAWRPQLVFSFDSIRTLFSFGWKILVSSVLDTLYVNIRTLLIGKLYSPSILGFYSRGQQFPHLIVDNINGSISSVMLPTLSSNQDNLVKVKNFMRRSIITSSFLIFPMMIGLAVVAEPLVIIVLTEKWLPAVPFIQIYSISFALLPIHTANLQAINAMGRSDIYLKIEIIKKGVGLLILGISIPFGVYAIALGQIVSSLLATFINAYPNKLLLNYTYTDQGRDIMPSLLISLVMGVLVYNISLVNLSSGIQLIAQVLIGLITYVGLAKILRIEAFAYLLNTARELMVKN